MAGASTSFTVNLNCDVDAYDHFGIVLNSGNSWSVTFNNIPSGVSCAVTEPAAGIPAGWEFVSVDPSGSVPVIANGTITFTVTNARLLGSITVEKEITGPVAGAST